MGDIDLITALINLATALISLFAAYKSMKGRK